MDFSSLEKGQKIYPVRIQKYERLIPDLDDQDFVTKMNSIVQYLNGIGKISSQVVDSWNRVMDWVMNEGLTEETQKQINSLIDTGVFDQIINESQAGWKAEVDEQLAEKAQKDEVRLNTVKLGQNDMTEEFLQQMAGTTPINSIPQDKSVTPAKTTFFKYGKNLLNKIDPDVLLGAYYNSSNVLTTDAGYNQSGFISVEAGQNYTASYKQNIVNWYGIDKNFLSSTPSATFSSQGYVTAPTGAYYARFMSPVANWETLQVEKGMASTPYETYEVSIDSQFLPSSSVNVLKDKRFTSFGDSITAQGMWQSYVKDYFSLIHTNLGIDSTTVAYVADRETTYPCFTNASRIQAIKDSNPDIITILGGTNDAHLLTPVGTTPSISRDITRLDKTTFKGGYAFLIETLLTWKPTLEIVMLSPMQSGYMTNPYSTYVNAAKEIADFYALPFVDLYKESGISYYNINTYTSDSLHPNAVGGKRIANMTIDKFKMIGTV